MTFKDVAIKTFKFNIKKYFMYFLCSIFCVTVFFMFGTLIFNGEIVQKLKETFIYDTMIGTFFVIGLFDLFFITYAYLSFIKYRTQELGLFMTLGMGKKDINKLIKIENRVISVASLIVGLIAGTIFSRIFFMISTKMLNLKKIQYVLNYKNYLVTVIVFIVIFFIAQIITKIYISKLEISQLLMERRKAQNFKKSKPILGVLGIVIIIVSFILMYLTIDEKILKNADANYIYVIYIVASFLGLYFAVSQFGSLIMQFSKINKKKYYKKILSISEINYKFSSYKNILYVVSVLSAAAVFFIGFIYGLYVTTLKTIELQNPYDIMYIERQNQNKLPENELEKVFKNKKTSLKEQKSLEFIQMDFIIKANKKKKDLQDQKSEIYMRDNTILSDQKVSELLNKKIDVKKGHVSALRDHKENNFWLKKGKQITLTKGSSIKENSINDSDKKMYNFLAEDQVYDVAMNLNSCEDYSTNFCIILDKEDYDKIVKENGKNILCKAHLFSFKQWKKTDEIYNCLIEKLKYTNPNLNKDENSREFKLWESGIVSKYKLYTNLLSKNEFCFFVMTFIGVLFFISSGTVLYFKVYSDVFESKFRYRQLNKIGITDKEMKKVISNELKPIFFIPIALGSGMGFYYIAVITQNLPFYTNVILNCILIILIYFILQTIFYLLTKGKVIKETIN